MLGHFTMAPVFREVFDDDPLGARALEGQTRFLQKLARVLSRAGKE